MVNPNRRSDIQETFSLLVGHYRKSGRDEEALDLFVSHISVCESIAAKIQDTTKAQSDLAKQYGTAAKVMQDARPKQARIYYEKALSIWNTLQSNPDGNTDFSRDIKRAKRSLERLKD